MRRYYVLTRRTPTVRSNRTTFWTTSDKGCDSACFNPVGFLAGADSWNITNLAAFSILRRRNHTNPSAFVWTARKLTPEAPAQKQRNPISTVEDIASERPQPLATQPVPPFQRFSKSPLGICSTPCQLSKLTVAARKIFVY